MLRKIVDIKNVRDHPHIENNKFDNKFNRQIFLRGYAPIIHMHLRSGRGESTRKAHDDHIPILAVVLNVTAMDVE